MSANLPLVLRLRTIVHMNFPSYVSTYWSIGIERGSVPPFENAYISVSRMIVAPSLILVFGLISIFPKLDSKSSGVSNPSSKRTCSMGLDLEASTRYFIFSRSLTTPLTIFSFRVSATIESNTFLQLFQNFVFVHVVMRWCLVRQP